MNLKEKLVVKRNEKGEILPVEVEIEIDGETEKVKVKPIPIGKAHELQQFQDANSLEAIEAAAKILSEHFVEPSFSVEEAKDLKVGYAGKLVNALLAVSGSEKKILQTT